MFADYIYVFCHFGDDCKYIHGEQCPKCMKYCLHPNDIQFNENHLNTCIQDNNQECTVCFETIHENKNLRFGLLSCNHCVCLDCIRTWRENAISTAKLCPICRSTTFFVTPSTIWPNSYEHKQQIIQEYKNKMR